MDTAILPELALDPRRKRWTRQEAERLSELFPLERYELIEGELINKMGQNPLHALLVAVLMDLFLKAFPGRVRVQTSIALPDPDGRYSEPEPDLAVLLSDVREFRDRHPGPEDIGLLVEVADTTLNTDRDVKGRLYAHARIAEYWIVDVQRRSTLVCRNPAADGYASVNLVPWAEPLRPLIGWPGEPLRIESALELPATNASPATSESDK
jgi:Uma2 family endonuclease